MMRVVRFFFAVSIAMMMKFHIMIANREFCYDIICRNQNKRDKKQKYYCSHAINCFGVLPGLRGGGRTFLQY